MKTKNIIFIIVTIIISMACSTDNDPDSPSPNPNPNSENMPPSDFNLIEASDGAMEVDTRPTLSWGAASDPDGDPVSYDLYLDTNTNPLMLYESNISGSSFELTDRLQWQTKYYWKVVAKDGKGGETASDTFGFTTRNVGFQNEAEIDHAAFSARLNHTVTVFDDKLWVIGGYDGDEKNDVWYSSDGIDWTEATPAATFSPRMGHTTLVYENKLWVIAGHDGGSFSTNDVWYSSDGISWTEATNEAAFPKKHFHTSAVFDDKMWVIAGRNTGFYNDIWYSSDGVTWTEVPLTPFSKRILHTSVVYNDKLWVIGGADGGYLNDVWSSSDGINWMEVTPEAAFSARTDHTSTVFADRLWTIAGYMGGGLSGHLNDVWNSSDGITWTETTAAAPFPTRTGHDSAVFDNKLWVIGGTTNNILRNDVWVMD